MKNFTSIALFFFLGSKLIFGQAQESDASMMLDLDELVITSTKETNEMKTLPGSVSFITPRMMEELKINSIVDLSAIVPNFYIPRYGSKMSTPVYIRGIGERTTGQSIGLYVDNMPYLDKSVFNFEFLDVQRIEVLRGPQGTLYGRNAMSGIINVYTYSPLDYEKIKVALTGGTHGLMRANASVSRKIGNIAGFSLSGYYDGHDGFFENQYDEAKSADKLRSGGGRARFDLRLIRPEADWTMQLMANYDYSEQGAFPYGKFENGKIEQPNYDHPGSYTRTVLGANLNLEFKDSRYIITSSTGFQQFDDNMDMDLDYTDRPVFTINQKQTDANWTQEFAVKSNTQDDYQWSFGAFAFMRNLTTDVTTTMKNVAITEILQPTFPPFLMITDDEIPIPGTFETPAFGTAIFHQSTFNDLLIRNMSLTAGLRLDYETTKLKYDTGMEMNINDVRPVIGGPQIDKTHLTGSGSMHFYDPWFDRKIPLNVLPKITLKYSFHTDPYAYSLRHSSYLSDPIGRSGGGRERYVYASASRGYKAGGYNIQTFADIVEKVAMERNPEEKAKKESKEEILKTISYQPEYSFNYEAGFKGGFYRNMFYLEAAVFYIDVRDVLITQFVESGHGRMLLNAGRAESRGVDLALTVKLTESFTLSSNYGYARAVFKNYKTGEKDETGNEIDYSGNFIPFAPQNTFSFGANYNRRLQNRIIDRLSFNAQYSGAGKIYWDEANSVYQDLYGLLNLKAGISKGVFWLNVWTRNVLDTNYAAFYFATGRMNLAQKGTPRQIGADLTVAF